MRKLLSTLLVFVVAAVVPPFTALPVAAADCRYVLGFKALHDAITDIVGDCVENENYNTSNGDSLQRTTRGLLAWRKADNFTAFTDGYRSWVNGPFGIQQRLNSERFEWEKETVPPASMAPPRVLHTSASAITSPPSSMDGINTHMQLYGTGADPAMITLGPKEGGREGWQPYPGKLGMGFEVPDKAPILAPLDMEFIGFDNRNAKMRPGQPFQPYNDLELCFRSTALDWPGLIFCVYHLYSTPLLRGHHVDAACSEIETWGTIQQSRGLIFYGANEGSSNRNYESCKDLIGRHLLRGELIGYAGRVGDHSFADVIFKVAHNVENPTVKQGSNRFLHWVQPGSFFYWKCYRPDATFPSGVLAYPFECGGYQLPSEQRNVSFKSTPTEEPVNLRGSSSAIR